MVFSYDSLTNISKRNRNDKLELQKQSLLMGSENNHGGGSAAQIKVGSTPKLA